MADKGKKSSMKTFAPNDKAYYYSGITSITVNGKNAYELKGKFLDDLHNNAFSGTNRKGAVSDDESSDLEKHWSGKEEETAKNFKIETDVFKYETPLCLAFNEFNYLLKKNDGYCNGGNLHGAYIVRNSLHYQDYEWYEALKDNELKDEALRNKAIMEGLISDNESSNDCWKRWKSHEINYHDYNKGEYENETHEGGHELCEEYVAVKEDEYNNLTITSEEACQANREIFRMMDEGWMITRTE
ncbi:hypothetical protein Tco_0772465 [Tanacetum coccineum]|uniref:Uncharacterized protein n=1 Tax=Tanacetum coccineum TaxID=301880 RepID=A0ABQ4ZHZ9_9ASTR